jgi:glycosyltransferase involved in cell wall biosynthesis
MRWLLVGNSKSIHVQRLAAELAAQGVDIHVADFGETKVDRVTSHSLGSARQGRSRYFVGVQPLRRLITRLRPDVVNAHFLTSYGMMAAMAHPSGLVQTVYGTDVLVNSLRPGWRQASAWALRRAAAISGCSVDLLDRAGTLAPGVPSHRFVFAPPRRLNDPVAISGAKDRLLVSARGLEPLYRVGLILEAWSIAADRLPDHRLVVAGDGTERAGLEAVAPTRTEFVGQLAYDDLLALLVRAQMMISVPVSDASSASVLEAMASGASVVASDLPAMRELLPDSHLLPSHAGARELADLMVARVDDPPALGPGWWFEDQVSALVEMVDAAVRH